MKNPQDIHRRAFLKQTAAAGATLAFPAAALPAQGKASERVNVAVIGCGGMGNAHIGALLALRDAGLVSIRAVCDVFTHRLDHARSRTAAEGFKDHRQVLDLKGLFQ